MRELYEGGNYYENEGETKLTQPTPQGGASEEKGEPVMPDDNWGHRSFGMRCRTCMWYVPKGTTKLGRCRHNAPTLDGWPAVYESDWCGQHKLNEDVVGHATPVSVEAA